MKRSLNICACVLAVTGCAATGGQSDADASATKAEYRAAVRAYQDCVVTASETYAKRADLVPQDIADASLSDCSEKSARARKIAAVSLQSAAANADSVALMIEARNQARQLYADLQESMRKLAVSTALKTRAALSQN
ncbi:hypothetical protein [Ralstonia syzygii]|uniref:hypothetical protein n=1 Tax=Ralstonia syzygii TaxID=28097 RepID=UPI003518CBD0